MKQMRNLLTGILLMLGMLFTTLPVAAQGVEAELDSIAKSLHGERRMLLFRCLLSYIVRRLAGMLFSLLVWKRMKVLTRDSL